DTRRLDFTGETFKLSDKLWRDPLIGYYNFSVSDNGVLVFDPSLEQRLRRQYRWVDRRGQTINVLNAVTGGYGPSLSRDEKRFIADRFVQSGPPDLWLYDISGGNVQRFTSDPASDLSPVWAPDGSSIVWASQRNGGIYNLYQKATSFEG